MAMNVFTFVAVGCVVVLGFALFKVLLELGRSSDEEQENAETFFDSLFEDEEKK